MNGRTAAPQGTPLAHNVADKSGIGNAKLTGGSVVPATSYTVIGVVSISQRHVTPLFDMRVLNVPDQVGHDPDQVHVPVFGSVGPLMNGHSDPQSGAMQLLTSSAQLNGGGGGVLSPLTTTPPVPSEVSSQHNGNSLRSRMM